MLRAENEIAQHVPHSIALQVLWELTSGALGRAPAAVTDNLPPGASREEAAPVEEIEDEKELEEMQSRLQALRS
ncbi:charged multivesicular body protein 3-like [Lycorma delicatula]|uniref:charged multivesicular body protein 3-like n=1 Tax=Lycorma delicatula TaxID=130591 RepID=UPI003F518982